MPPAKVADPTIRDIFSKAVVIYPGNPTIRLREIEKSLKKVEKLDSSDYFGFEDPESQIEELELKLEKEKTHILMARKGFREIDPEFLEWRKKTDKLPAFIILELDSESKEFRISVNPDEDDIEESLFETDPELPEALEKRFHEVQVYLAQLSLQSHDGREISITAKVRGFMDGELREKVRSVQESDIFDEIYVVAEAQDWKIDETSYLKKDPLVLGYVSETEQLFVIGSYDLTDLEQLILTSHTS